MQTKTSQSTEDYLKAIYEITREIDRASTNEIAELMGVAPSSATGMIQKLASIQPPLLRYEKHFGATLTPEGERIALEIIRHHRLLETFLYEKLDYTWDQVHEEADRLEHVISEEMEERIAHVLGDPLYDPHGDPIPNREFRLPKQSRTTLAEMHPGEQETVVRITTSNPDLLRYLASIGLSIHSKITVIDISPFDDNTELKLTGKDGSFVLGRRVTDRIFVEPDLTEEKRP
jgi:DtxR family Mn-dependent transcriptional regulator